jgi:MFS family permease
MQAKPTPFLLPIIVFSQFAGTSLWFAGNAILKEIQKENTSAAIANLTSLVQFGFITGTLVFAVLTIADRFKPSVVFFISSCIAALANALIIIFSKDIVLVSALRFITGFFLAGIYPVGMKIAADWFPRNLGNALGFLVGALVLGTAFPYLLKSQLYALPWKDVLLFTSLLAFLGGLILLLTIPSKTSVTKNGFEPKAFLLVFRSANFRSAAFGYFGHMWELYTFWAFIPVLLQRYNQQQTQNINIYSWSFLIIAAGCIGCIIGGIISQKTGSKKVAFISLAISGLCCVLAPFAFGFTTVLFLFFLLVWGTAVVSDSPQFSSLVAQSAMQQYKGTALTIVTSIGFAITIVSIQLMQMIFQKANEALWILVVGPLLGLIALNKWEKSLPAKNRQSTIIER